LERFIGLISGTSVDCIDAVILDVQGQSLALHTSHSHPVPPALQAPVHRIIAEGRAELSELGRLDRELGECFSAAALAVLQKAHLSPADISAIGSHGQTVYHGPDAVPPFTMQIGDPNIIAERTGITTVADLRRRDMAVGGQGAPLAPLFHHAAFTKPGTRRYVVNIGGIANVSVLPEDAIQPVMGFDTGPGNTLLDEWIFRHRGERPDTDGRWASSGESRPDLLALLLTDPYFALAAPKSTGREYFHLQWLERHLARRGETVAARDVQRTLCELTATTIAAAIEPRGSATEVFVCGGGAFNSVVMAELARKLETSEVQTTAALGIGPEWIEACAFAWLASLHIAGCPPAGLGTVTGAERPVVLGGMYPGQTGKPTTG